VLDVSVARPVLLGHVHQPERKVHLAQAAHGGLHHALVHAVGRLVDAGRVEEDDLAVGPVQDGQDAVAGRLRLVGDDRDLVAHQPVDERGLAHVGPADDGDEARVEGGRGGGLGRHGVGASATRRNRTRFTRLRSASITSTSKPRYSTLSPGRGTRPNTAVTSPPTVPTFSPSLRGASRACSSRSTFTRPATTTAPSRSTLIGSASTSYSSLISPTISSTMSSTVTRPAVPPYSSITTAKLFRPAWNSFSRSAIFFVSGTTKAARASGPTGSEPSPSYSTRSRTLATPTTSSRFSPYTGTRLYLVSRKIRR